ncbi:MAG TPA: DegT/DnrJ/EryC1/StrS family aminotransferase [Vicinamibacterales bacterium]|nr:DegT/DnrJ/EryC1/StrS family aminotransferase [Vicinamibacterales bacterium]
MTSFIPVNEPRLDGNELKYLTECVETGWISSEGRFVEELERQVARHCGRRFGVAVANGSVALDAAVLAAGIGEGDEVILPSFTIISCAAAIVRAGAIPVVVDSEPGTWNMDVRQLERKLTARTKAIMPVHIYGLPVDMDPLLDLAQRRGLVVIEDAAEVIGQTYKGRPCGSFGDVSTLSFYPNKHVTTGEGGMILTDDERIAARCRSLRNLCFQQKRFVHDELGYNFRMSNLQAAVGVAQIERIDDSVRRKREIGVRYGELLRDLAQLELPIERTDYAENIYWVFGVVLNDDVPFDAEVAMKRLAELGVGTRPFFWPMHEQPVFQRMGWFAGERCPVAERLARRGFYLPSGLALTDEQIERVAAAVRQVVS